MDGWLARRIPQTCALTQVPTIKDKRDATRADTKGGIDWNKGWDTAGNWHCGLVSTIVNNNSQYTCSPPIFSNIDTAIADTGATTGHYLPPQAPITNINHNAGPTTVSTANGDLIHSLTTASLNLPNLPPGTNVGLVMQTFANNLLSMGVFCDAGCTVTFTGNDIAIYNSAHKLIMRGFRETTGARMWRFSLINANAANAIHALVPTASLPTYQQLPSMSQP